MSFQRVSVPERREFCRPLAEGETSIAKTGWGTFNLADLALANIGDQVALLADCGTLRIGLRRPRLPEDSGAVTGVLPLRRRGRPVRGRMQIPLGPAIRELGLTLAAARGRYKLVVKDDLLIADLGQAVVGEGERG